jgi:hypothetical protein
MKRFGIKVSNSSYYWSDFEGELCIYGFIRWKEAKSLKLFYNDIVQFAWDYIILSQKFGIAMSVRSFENIHHFESEYRTYKNKFNDVRNHNPLLFLHLLNNVWMFPSLLFTDLEKQPDKVICINPILKIEEIEGECISHSSSMPIKVGLDIGSKGIQLYYYLDNDLFNLFIDNKKTKRDPNIGGKGFWVDNSELAYLNTPRLNSFLRDLKKLCFQYGATEFEFENLGLKDFSENGILFDNEIVYYEDIYDMLPSKHQIKKF